MQSQWFFLCVCGELHGMSVKQIRDIWQFGKNGFAEYFQGRGITIFFFFWNYNLNKMWRVTCKGTVITCKIQQRINDSEMKLVASSKRKIKKNLENRIHI